MSFDLEAELLNARLHVRQCIRRSAMLAKTAIHLEAERVRDDMDFSVQVAEFETELHRFRRQFGHLINRRPK